MDIYRISCKFFSIKCLTAESSKNIAFEGKVLNLSCKCPHFIKFFPSFFLQAQIPVAPFNKSVQWWILEVTRWKKSFQKSCPTTGNMSYGWAEPVPDQTGLERKIVQRGLQVNRKSTDLESWLASKKKFRQDYISNESIQVVVTSHSLKVAKISRLRAKCWTYPVNVHISRNFFLLGNNLFDLYLMESDSLEMTSGEKCGTTTVSVLVSCCRLLLLWVPHLVKATVCDCGTSLVRVATLDCVWHSCLADLRPNVQRTVTERLVRSRWCTRIPLTRTYLKLVNTRNTIALWS